LWRKVFIGGISGGVRTGRFGPTNGRRKFMWIKLGEFLKNGNWTDSGVNIKLYPVNNNHGNRPQTIMISTRNHTTGYYTPSIGLIIEFEDVGPIATCPVVGDVQVVHKSGSGSSNNVFSVWMQIGCSWLGNRTFMQIYYLGHWTELNMNGALHFDEIQDYASRTELICHSLFHNKHIRPYVTRP